MAEIHLARDHGLGLPRAREVALVWVAQARHEFGLRCTYQETEQEDLANFKRKVEAGADSALTQYFFNADCYLRFVDDCERMGLSLPIVPGIMPIANFSQLARFSEACGAEIPRWLRLKMQAYGEDTASQRALGLDVVTALCERLLAEGAPGLHFYTMNQADLTTEVWRRLGL